MTDIYGSIYVKNYRSDRLRLRQKYGYTSRHNSTDSLHSDYPPVGQHYGLSSGLSSLAVSTADLTAISNSSNSATNATLRSSSGYSSSDFGSSLGNTYENESRINQNGYSPQSCYPRQKATLQSFESPSQAQKPKYSILTAAVRLSADFSAGGLNSRAASNIDLRGQTPYSSHAVLPLKTGLASRPYYQYQRTYSGGTKIRCSSADPDSSKRLLAVENSSTLQVPPVVSNSLMMRYGRYQTPSGGVPPRTGNFSSSRCASADRFCHAGTAGSTLGNSMISLASSLWSQYNSFSNIYESNPKINVTCIASPTVDSLARYTPVTELARNVSSYKWDPDEVHNSKSYALGRSNSSLAIGYRGSYENNFGSNSNIASAFSNKAATLPSGWLPPSQRPSLSREVSMEEKAQDNIFEVINEEKSSRGSEDSFRHKSLVTMNGGGKKHGFELDAEDEATLARVSSLISNGSIYERYSEAGLSYVYKILLLSYNPACI